jgi:hypothetical protein
MFDCVEASRKVRLLSVAFSLLIIAVPPVLAQTHALTLPQDLSDLVAQSHVVVQGWITQVTLAPDHNLRNLMTVAVTVQVEDTFKGTSSGSYTFRQAVIDRGDQQQKLGYQPGVHVVLFLIKPNSYGLSSPAGMEQGVFRISRGPRGTLVAANSMGNAGLFRGLSSQVQQNSSLTAQARSLLSRPSPGPIDLQQLKTIVRAISSPGPMQ